ncbi:MAG: GNAT family N-acetyltransferase [Candidatus Levybacteria bacterium]|nr:GNAT family N-acetyltransferase [Candidatus Levybacteria bacterium]
MEQMSYQLVDKNDWETVYSIEKELSRFPLYYSFTEKSQFEKFMSESKVFLLYFDKKVAGYCSFEIKNKDLAEINGLAILEQFRNKGLGKFAMQLMLDKLENFKTIMLVTHPENNISLRLYLKFGFTIKEWRDNYINNQPRLILFLYRIN